MEKPERVLAPAASFDRKEKWESDSHKIDPQFPTHHVLLHTTFLLSLRRACHACSMVAFVICGTPRQQSQTFQKSTITINTLDMNALNQEILAESVSSPRVGEMAPSVKCLPHGKESLSQDVHNI